MVCVLLTGFEPFGGSLVNPSAELAHALREHSLPGTTFACQVLPVVGGESIGSAFAALDAAVRECDPVAIVAFGESAKATRIAFERVAINLRDDRIPDNRGEMLVDSPIRDGGCAAYFSTLPIRAMRDACEAEGIPAELSNSAGTFLCNELMYRMLEVCASGAWPRVRQAGFVHVPQLPAQAEKRGGPSMRLDQMAAGLTASLRELSPPLG
jgi:pyroglutamyl-peptidase